MTFQIEHSGKVWTSLGISADGYHIWPIEEFLARTRVSNRFAKKLKKLNPNGKPEGDRPMGWPCHKKMWNRHGR